MWDGSQEPLRLSAEDILDELAKDIFSYGDLQPALRRMIERGVNARQGERLQGLRDLLKLLKNKRDLLLARYNLDSVLDELADFLQLIVDKEKQALETGCEQLRLGQNWVNDGSGVDSKSLSSDSIGHKMGFVNNLPEDIRKVAKKISLVCNQEFLSDPQKVYTVILDSYAQHLNNYLPHNVMRYRWPRLYNIKILIKNTLSKFTLLLNINFFLKEKKVLNYYKKTKRSAYPTFLKEIKKIKKIIHKS